MERRGAQGGTGWLEARHWLVSGVSRDPGRLVSEMGPALIVITLSPFSPLLLMILGCK